MGEGRAGRAGRPTALASSLNGTRPSTGGGYTCVPGAADLPLADDREAGFPELVLTNLADLGMCYAACLPFPGAAFRKIASLSLSVWFHSSE